MASTALHEIKLAGPVYEDFAHRFGVTYFEGLKHYRPRNIDSSVYNSGIAITHGFGEMPSETGVAVEMTRANLDYLIKLVNEALDHHRARERNPAAAAAYDQYLTLYHLTSTKA